MNGGPDLYMCNSGSVFHRGERTLPFPAIGSEQAVRYPSLPFDILYVLPHRKTQVWVLSRDGWPGSPGALYRFRRLYPVVSSLAYDGPTKIVRFGNLATTSLQGQPATINNIEFTVVESWHRNIHVKVHTAYMYT